MEVMLNYFNELKEQIINKEKWDKERFHVYDYEAGVGKSRNTFRFVGDMTKEYPYRVLYVQRFVRDDELNQTVALINEHAGREVALAFTGDDSKSKKQKDKARNAQVLCITHRMYREICRGSHPVLIDNRNTLIIDEYPDLLEKISVSDRDVGYLWFVQYKFRNETIETLAHMLRDTFSECNKKMAHDKANQMVYIDFHEPEYSEIKSKLPNIIESISDKPDKILLSRMLQIVTNGCFLYEKKLHTFDNQFKFKMLDNNIILDANGFDHRYSLSNKFHIRHQPKSYEYSSSTFYHYEVKTSKKELSRQINLHEQALEKISLIKNERTLFITDKESQTQLEEKIGDFLSSTGMDDTEIATAINENFKVDYFGNIIGVNSYREFENVVVLKTPNFDYLTYALTYLFYRRIDNKPVEDVCVFRHEEVESIRKSAVAGEIYQGIKRINRNNSKQAKMYVFTTNQDAVDLILQQLPGIQYKKEMMDVNKRRIETNTKKTKFEEQVEVVKATINVAVSEGRDSIQKKEIRNSLGEIDKGNFARIIKACQSFIESQGYKNEWQRIILK
jgi:hypothetical protein